MTQIIDEATVYTATQKIHRNRDDFCDGDLGERIEQFTHYELTEIQLSELDLDEWIVDQDLVDEIAEMPVETMPPIIYDAVNKSIIDGIHRVNALNQLGHTQIKAYVGKENYLAVKMGKNRI